MVRCGMIVIDFWYSFRPLTGMVLRFDNGVEFRDRFSSPYGDGTKMAMENQFVYKFSPPCGDGTGGNCYVVYRL